jgi:hypothetical protein
MVTEAACGFSLRLRVRQDASLPNFLLTGAQLRLISAGLHPLRWYDCYIGDMVCSLTYSMGVSMQWT